MLILKRKGHYKTEFKEIGKTKSNNSKELEVEKSQK